MTLMHIGSCVLRSNGAGVHAPWRMIAAASLCAPVTSAEGV
jgi:hypothetical protein